MHLGRMPDIPSALRQLAAAQLGLVTRAQALQFLTERVLSRLVGPDGRWRIPVRGVYATFTGQLTLDQRRMCALLYAGRADGGGHDIPRALITGLDGLRLHKMYGVPDDDQLHLLIQHARRRQSRGFVLVERTRFYPARFSEIGGFPVAPFARCLVDASRHSRDLEVVRGLLIPNVQSGRVPLAALEEELARGTKAGSARPRLVISEIRAGAASVAEVPYIELLASSEVLPPAHHNCTLLTPSSAFLVRPDAYLDDVGLAGQLQSVRYHLAAAAQANDMANRERVAPYGVQILEIAPAEVMTRGQDHLAAWEATYLLRKQQGVRPNVLVKCRPGCPLRESLLLASGSRY
jgi:hypothetical protein